MGALGTLIIYGVIGLCVAVAIVLRDERGGVARTFAIFLAGWVFWPLFAPVLLGGGSAPARTGSDRSSVPPRSAFSPRIRAAEEQLLAALGKVEGLAEDVLTPEVARVRSVAGQMASMERRVTEMDELLKTAEFDAAVAQGALRDLATRGLVDTDPRVSSVRARLRNIERLKAMRDRTCEDLERVILKLEEMSSQLQLLKFAGRPDAEVVQLIKEVAESVEDVTEGLLAAG
jgi:hypothetical protein